MKKILHFNLFKQVPRGVVSQLVHEYEISNDISDIVDWNIKVFSNKSLPYQFHTSVYYKVNYKIPQAFINYVLLRIKAYQWLANVANEYDAVLLRHRGGDVFERAYCSRFGNFFTIHHTMEIPEAKTRGFPLNYIESILEKYIGVGTMKNSKGIIGVTPEIINCELSLIKNNKPSFCYPNGIDIKKYNMVSDKRRGVPKLLFVSSFLAPWHGLDLLVKKLAMLKEQFELHLVGNIKLNGVSDNRILHHGMQDEPYIENLASMCDLGIGSFGMFRNNMTQACTLKVRQYLAMGLPVFSGYIDAGLPSDFKYYRNSGLDAGEIIRFVHECRNYTREEVRSASLRYIDKKQLMLNLVNWLEGKC